MVLLPSRPVPVAFAILAALAVLGAAPPLRAQDTRTDAIAAEQAAKAQALTPPVPTRAERVLDRVAAFLTGPPRGLFPTVDSVYPGGGFTLGAVFQQPVGDRSFWNVRGLYSIRQYKMVDATVSSPGHAQGRIDFLAHAGWRDATQIAFYGLGTGTSQAARANFRLNQTFAGGEARARVVGPLVLTGSAYFEDFEEKDGQGDAPSIGERYTPATAPGLGLSPTYVHSSAGVGIDWRTAPGYSRSGGLYELRYHDFKDLDDRASFDRLDGEVVQHVPILRETWVLSLRGRVQTTLDDEDLVPYFLLPALGSGSTLRAYSSWRFRDRHSLLLQGEWRWFPNRLGLDMAIFYDAGKVTSRRADLDFNGLKSDVGVGVRLHGPTLTPLRVELAHGSEGWNLVFAGAAAF
jgi:hypothetical protein